MDRPGHSCRAIVLFVVLCGGRAAVAASAEDEFAVAAGHYAARRWDLAAEAFESFGRLFPDHALAGDARFYEAEALAQLGHFQKAALLLDDLIQDGRAGDRLRRAMFRRGEAAYLAQDSKSAARHLSEFCRAYPDDELLAYALPYLGEVHAAMGNHTQAETAYRAGLERFADGPLAVSCRRGLARALVAQGNLQEAQQLLHELAQSDQPGVAGGALLELARLAITQEDFAAARQHCEHLLSGAAQGGPTARLLLAHALHQLGELAAAIEQYEHVLAGATDQKIRKQAIYGCLRVAVERADHAEIERLSVEFLDSHGDSALARAVHAALGESRFAQDRHDQAIEAFRAALASGAEGAVAAQCRAGLAVSLAADGKLTEARDHLSLLRSDHPQHWDLAPTAYRVAELAYAAGARDVAAELFAEVAERASSPHLAAKALAGLAWARLRQEDLAGSAEAFEKLLEDHPDDPRAAEAGLLRAQILERRGEHDAALATYRRLREELAGEEVLPKALYLAARLHDRLQQASEARPLYERLIKEYPQHEHTASARYHLGWLLRNDGEPDAAFDAWQSIHDQGQQAPHWREATYLLAEKALERGDAQRAQRLVDRLVAAFEGDTISHGAAESDADVDAGEKVSGAPDASLYARTLLLAARLAMDRDDWKTARDFCKRLVDACPADPLHLPAQFWMAEAEYRLQRFAEAYDQFERLESAVDGRDEREDAWIPFVPLRRAQILAHQNEWSRAREAAQQVIDRYADFPLRYHADYVVGRCLAAAGDFDAARQAYHRVIESESGGKSETAAMAQWMIGETYMHQQDYDTALRAYLRGEILFPYPEWQAHSLLQAGKCYELLGDWDKARATYGRLVDRFADSGLEQEARTRLNIVKRYTAGRTN